jgi:hypothetical protein
MSEDRFLDERSLRASLRLDADERPRRLDPARIRAAAEREAPMSAPTMLLGSISVAILSLAGLVVALRVAEFAVTLLTSGEVLAAAIMLITLVAARLEAVLALVTQPAVPIAILTCLIIAAYYERRQAEGEGHVRAS